MLFAGDSLSGQMGYLYVLPANWLINLGTPRQHANHLAYIYISVKIISGKKNKYGKEINFCSHNSYFYTNVVFVIHLRKQEE